MSANKYRDRYRADHFLTIRLNKNLKAEIERHALGFKKGMFPKYENISNFIRVAIILQMQRDNDDKPAAL